MANTTHDEERLVELEVRFTLQQSTLQELSDMLVAQQKEIAALQKEVSHLKKKLEAEPGLVNANDNERPPHY